MPILFETDININSEPDFLTKIEAAIENDETRYFAYLNTYSLYLLNHDAEFRTSFLSSDFISADGASIKWAYFLVNKSPIHKVTFSHFFFSKLSEFLKEKKARIYCIGSSETNITKSVEALKTKHSLNILGYRNGFFDEIESEEIIREINQFNPEILLVGAGMPKSENWIFENKNSIKSNCIISVGNFFDITSGSIKLAPSFLFNSGLEWTYRLAQEPKRLLPRYVKANSYFVYKLMRGLWNRRSSTY